MRIRTKVYLVSLSLFALTAGHAIVSAQAADLDTHERALEIISVFADKFCKTVPLQGEMENIQLSAQGKAELNKLLKKIADLGFQGAAEYQKSEYAGVLQKDIATLLKNNMECRATVWRDLKDKLLEPKKPLATTATKISPSNKSDAKINKNNSKVQSPDENKEITVNGNYNSVVKINEGNENTTSNTININNPK